ncbi:MAG: VWA-like domain-containing protein [Gammaproteobacteria bacterium]|nr:VWA-like domain-containing protein [Gammaproteobacteria bacterium]
MSEQIDTKLAAARTRLILDKPFLGALVLRLPMIAANSNWCKSVATDAKAFYYNPEYIDDLTVEHVQFVLAHEALHCALSHFARRLHRDKHRWDLACDLAINPLLVEDGLTPVPEALLFDAFEGMTAEEIYPMLDEHEDLTPQDEHVYDKDDQDGEGGETGNAPGQGDSKPQEGGKGSHNPEEDQKEEGGSGADRPEPLSKDEQEQLSVQWAQRMAGAAQTAMQAGKLSGSLARMIDHLLQPQLPWRMLLARYMTATARDDYNYARPSRREGSAIMPSLKSHELKVVVALDTSGSVTDNEMRQFLSEINAIKAQAHAKITLIACDAKVDEAGPWVYEPWEDFTLPQEFPGGGGTDFRPAFEWTEGQSPQPDLMLYFTDAQGNFPETEPPYPVIWLVKGKQKVPWGQRIQLN